MSLAFKNEPPEEPSQGKIYRLTISSEEIAEGCADVQKQINQMMLPTWEELSQNPERFYALHLADEERSKEEMRKVSLTPESMATINNLPTMTFDEFVPLFVHNEIAGRELVSQMSSKTSKLANDHLNIIEEAKTVIRKPDQNL